MAAEYKSFDRKKAIEELVRGRELASRLQNLMQMMKPFREENHGLMSGEDLAAKILGSLTNAISVLKSGETGDVCHRHHSPTITQVISSPSSYDPRSEDSSNKIRKISAAEHKRRKTSQTWNKLSATPFDDGYAWRKYGQKEILNAKFPRNYFRCTHKKDQGCQAIKQVQRTEEDPPMYLTTYMGNHTCRDDTLKFSPQLIFDSSPTQYSCMLDFQSSKQDSAPFLSIKQECKDELTQPEYLLPTLIESSDQPTKMLAQGEVIYVGSSMTSYQSLEDMDLLVESVDFIDDVFHFDDVDEFKF